MNELQSYLNTCSSNINNRNGNNLAKLLALPLPASLTAQKSSSQTYARPTWTTSSKDFATKISNLNLNSSCERLLNDTSTATLVAYRLHAVVALISEDYENAYRHINASYNACLDYFGIKEENTTWIIPVVVRVSNDLRILAEMVDDKAGDMNHKFLRESLGQLTRGFTIVAKDRTPITVVGSKKLAIFAVTNVLFKIYFRVNTLQLCGKLINVVEGPGGIMDHLQLFPICDVAMYKYYIGRLKMFEDRYEEARDCLRFSLKYCPKTCLKNKQRILASLVPIEMCLGVMPKKLLETKYGLGEFYAIGEAVRRGDLGRFNELLTMHQSSFVRIGVYLVLEQVKVIAYRNIFKKIYVLSNNTRLNLHIFESVMKWLNEQVDLDEIECILSNLIFQNRLKGYISHQKRFLIVSKTEPFPTSVVIKKAKV